MTVTQQEVGQLFNWKVWPHPHFYLCFACPSWAHLVSGANRHQNCDIWLPSEVFACWLMMKKRRLEFESEESCQRHSQHHTCSFLNNDQVLPISGNLNSKVCLVSNGTSDTSFISPTSDRVTNGSYWSLTPPKPYTLNADRLPLSYMLHLLMQPRALIQPFWHAPSGGPDRRTVCPPSPSDFLVRIKGIIIVWGQELEFNFSCYGMFGK